MRYWGLLGCLFAACGGSGSAAVDAGGEDATVAVDAGVDGGASLREDAGELDAGGDDDAGTDAGPDPNDVDDDDDGFTENEGDCADDDPTRSPAASEICDDGIDQDCDGDVDDLAEGMLVGPAPYRDRSGSPWAAEDFAFFLLEDFEDGMLPPGVTASTSRLSSTFGPSVIDSVDGDDGDPTDGMCSTCDALWASTSITFTFDPEILGGLPTHVGLVLTDAFTANVNARVSATSTCTSLGELSTDVTFGDGSVGGETEEDRFVGIVAPAGMTSFTVNVGGPLEVDHLQLGY